MADPLDSQDPVVVTPHQDGNRVVFDWQQPGWDRILEGLKEVRDRGLTRGLSFGVTELEIPVGMLYFLKRRFPDLDSPDSMIKTAAWKKFLASPMSKPFRTRNRGGALARSFGGVSDGRKS